jgi:RNA polymerase sigma factor (sigma-70 family)
MRAAIEKVVSSNMVRSQDEYYFINQSSGFLTEEDLNSNIQGCVLNDRLSQKKIYTSFYNYAMAICRLYTSNHDDSVEILNDGFLKVFKEVYRYQPAYANVISSFRGWLRKIMIHTAIDHFRKNHKHRFTKELDSETTRLSAGGEDALDRISYNEIVESMQKLTPGYRIIFNLFIIENFSHEEISKQLGISIGTSKSNLARARKQLQKILLQQNQIKMPATKEGVNSSIVDTRERNRKNVRVNTLHEFRVEEPTLCEK